MTQRVKIKVKPNEEIIPVVTLEEFLEAQELSYIAHREIEERLIDVNRTIDVVEALEELAVVTDNISDVSKREAHLIEIGGNIAVAGTTLNPVNIMPSTEEHVDGSVSLENANFKEKLAKIWEMIKKAFRIILEKINEFRKNSKVMVAHSLNNLRKLGEVINATKDKVPDPRNNIPNINATAFVAVLNDGSNAVGSASEINKLLVGSNRLYDDFYRLYTAAYIDSADRVTKLISSITPDNIKTTSLELKLQLQESIKKIFNSITFIMTNDGEYKPSSNKSNTDGDGSLKSVRYLSNGLGGLVYEVTRPDQVADGADVAQYIERVRQSGIKVRYPDDIKGDPTIREIYKMDEVKDLFHETEKLIKKIREFKDRGSETKISNAQKDLEKATEAMMSRFAEADEASVTLMRSIMSLNTAFINWSKSPMIEMTAHALRIEKVISWLIKKNLALYTVSKSK